MSNTCQSLHEYVSALPRIAYPFEVTTLPRNGIYFFFENGEQWGHGGSRQRIVRVGTHRDGNFRSRISEHYLLDNRKMNFDATRPAPHDRSVFRKNLGRALLNRSKDPYLQIWEICFTHRTNRERYGHMRDVEKEKTIETQISMMLRENFAFCYIEIENQAERMGLGGLEARFIGTVSNCMSCRPSRTWLGSYSPKQKIRDSGLWLVQHLNSTPLSEIDLATLREATPQSRSSIPSAQSSG